MSIQVYILQRSKQEPDKQQFSTCPQPSPPMQQPMSISTNFQQDPSQIADTQYEAHSPQSTGSPEPPAGILTDAEAKLWELVLAIHSVQTRFNRPMANGNGLNGAPSHQQLMLAEPIQGILRKMIDVDEIAGQIPTRIPRQAIEDLDSSHHPGHVVKEKIEAVALENAFLNGKMTALSSFRDLLGDALADSFPELSNLRRPAASAHAATSEQAVPIKTEEV